MRRPTLESASQVDAGRVRASAKARVSVGLLTAAIAAAVIHPLVLGLDDDTLRSELLRLARRLLHLPE